MVKEQVQAVLGLILGVVLIGYMLPVSHQASQTVLLNSPKARVWKLLSEYKNYKSWRSGLEKVEVLDGAAWREVESGGDAIGFRIVESLEGQCLVSQITDKELPFGGTWTYELKTEAKGTRLTITEDGEVYNPVFRFVSYFIIGHESSMKLYVKDLQGALDL